MPEETSEKETYFFLSPQRNHSSNTLIEYSQEAFELGEKILQENRETRDHQDRLKQIEDELVQLQTQVEREVRMLQGGGGHIDVS